RCVRRRARTCARCGLPRRQLPLVRHDLQRDAGPAGRRGGAARGAAGRDGRGRRIQLEQYALTGGDVRAARSHVSRGRCDVPRRGRRYDPAPAHRRAGRGGNAGVARDAGPGSRRDHGRREHAQQQDRRCGGAHLRHARRRSARRRMTTIAAPPVDFGSAELRAGATRVVVVPALGGKIIAMELGGREWLWRSRARAARPADGASYRDTGDTGGIDECFPTVAPCVLPTGVARYGGLALPDHGELWSQPSTFALDTRDDGVYASCAWHGRRMAYRFVRTIVARASAQVEIRYAVTNDGRAPLPFVWSSHAAFPLDKDTRVVLPESTRVRVWAEQGIALGGPGAEMR